MERIIGIDQEQPHEVMTRALHHLRPVNKNAMKVHSRSTLADAFEELAGAAPRDTL